jgi:hypothetical protein
MMSPPPATTSRGVRGGGGGGAAGTVAVSPAAAAVKVSGADWLPPAQLAMGESLGAGASPALATGRIPEAAIRKRRMKAAARATRLVFHGWLVMVSMLLAPGSIFNPTMAVALIPSPRL